jgi:hypothetical protein
LNPVRLSASAVDHAIPQAANSSRESASAFPAIWWAVREGPGELARVSVGTAVWSRSWAAVVFPVAAATTAIW